MPLRVGKDRWTACVSELRILALSPGILLECVVSAPPEALTDDALFLNEQGSYSRASRKRLT